MTVVDQFIDQQAPSMPTLTQPKVIQQPQVMQQKNDPPGTPVGPYNAGDNGIFFMPYSNNGLVSTLIMPRGGLIDNLPVLATDPYDNLDSGIFGSRQFQYDTIMTGLTEGDIETFANQPTDECAIGPTGGLVKLCTLLNTLGRYRGSTREVALFRAGLAESRLDELAHRLLNTAPAFRELFGSPDNMPEQNSIIMSEMSRRLFELLTSWRRYFSREIWIGSPVNNNGEARQIVGLQTHINEGNKFDAFSGAQCIAADSIVLDFAFNAVEGGDARDIVEYLETAEYNNRINAERMGLGPVDGVVVMKESLFTQLTGALPIKQYQEVMAALQNQLNSDNSRLMINATDAQRERNDMRANFQIPINGRMFRVIIDDGIPEDDSTTSANLAAGEFSSDIYFIPITVMGGMPATFFEFYNHNNAQAQGILQRVSGNQYTFVSDGGTFRWYVNFSNGCMQLTFDFSPWLKCKFPMVGWRITNVKYTPTLRPREAFPDSDYFADGGNVATSSQPRVQVVYPPWADPAGSAENI